MSIIRASFDQGLPVTLSQSDSPLNSREAERLTETAVDSGRLDSDVAERLAANLRQPGVLGALADAAFESKRRGKGDRISVSKNVFLPLTNLCRDRCGYCTFAKLPGDPAAKTWSLDEVADAVRGALERDLVVFAPAL